MLHNSFLVLSLVCALVGCAPRGEISTAAPSPNATVQDVWVANLRSDAPPPTGQVSPPRTATPKYERYRVSVPPVHRTGQIEWPRGTPDADTDFVTLARHVYPNARSFAGAVARSDDTGRAETVLFVHGFNNTHAEAVYQLGQMKHDFQIPSPTVLFSWPSSGKAVGYIYDRDSVFFARDQLERLIIDLTRSPRRRLLVVGHSLGSLLVMETLRQMELSGSLDIASAIDGVFLISPDIDGELFYAQASRLSRLPEPFIIFSARQDKALRLSALLTGRQTRLGSLTDRTAVRDLAVSVIDISDLGDGGTNHTIGFTSPSAIAILNRLTRETWPGDAEVAPQATLSDILGD